MMGRSDAEIVAEFAGSSREYQRLGVRADVLRFLAKHEGQLVQAVQQAFAPSVRVGGTESEVREWLSNVEAQLRVHGQAA